MPKQRNTFEYSLDIINCIGNVMLPNGEYKFQVAGKYRGCYSRTRIKVSNGHEYYFKKMRSDNILKFIHKNHKTPLFSCKSDSKLDDNTDFRRFNATKSNNYYVNKIKRIYGDTISILSNIKGCLIPFHAKCNRCGFSNWYPNEHQLVNDGIWCPKCYEKYKASKLERLVMNYLDNHNYTYKYRYIFKDGYLSQKHLDFLVYNKDVLIGIECQGIQHYRSVSRFGGQKRFKEGIKSDMDKIKYCPKYHINLIHVGDPKNLSQHSPLIKLAKSVNNQLSKKLVPYF